MADQPRHVEACAACSRPPPFATHFRFREFRLARCPRCHLVFQDPQPGDEVLDGAYYHLEEFTDLLFGEYRGWTLDQARSHADALHRLAPLTAGRLLDVGCSSGAWLELATALGWAATGVELGEATARAARGRGLDVLTGTLADVEADLPAATFDLITLWDVLEHVREPGEELTIAARLLRPGGHLALSCPNVEGLYPVLTHRLLARTVGVWEHPELPVHLYDFSPATLTRLLARHGFTVRGVTTDNTPFAHFAATSLAPGYSGHGRRGRGVRAAFGLLHRVVAPVAPRLGRGDAMTVVASLA